jgi:hypothetical protein
MKLFNRDSDNVREIWRAGSLRIGLFVASAVIAALSLFYIAAAAGF